MKKIIIAAAAMLLVPGISALADINVLESNLQSEIITVAGNVPSGREGIFVDITVTNPGYTLSDISKAESIQYKSAKKSGKDGKYEFKIKVNDALLGKDESGAAIGGLFTVYVAGDDGFSEERQIYFAPGNVRNAAIEKLLESKDEDELSVRLIEYKDELGLDSLIFNSVDKSKLSGIIFKKLPNLGVNKDNVQNIINQYAVISAFNEGLSDILFSDNTFCYEDLMGIKTLDADKGCTLKAIFDTKITDEGKKIAAENMYKKGFGETEDIIGAFSKETVLKGLSHSKESGYGIVGEVLTAENAKLSGLDLTKYVSLTESEKSAADKIIIGKTYSSIAELQKAIDDAADEAKKGDGGTSTGKGSGGVGGGSSSSASSGGFSSPGATVTPEKTYPFDDMEGTAWAKDAVLALSEKGIINGVGEKKFNPNGKITREQLAKMICLGFSHTPSENAAEFSDVISGEWYEPYVAALSEKGIINGIGGGKFGVGKNVTREDIAVMIYRTIGSPEYSGMLDFSDNADISDYAKSAVGYFCEKGIISGFPDKTFRPKEPCTRAQAAKVMADVLGLR